MAPNTNNHRADRASGGVGDGVGLDRGEYDEVETIAARLTTVLTPEQLAAVLPALEDGE